MENTKVYHSIFDLLSENRPEFINGLTEEQRDILEGCDSYEFQTYQLVNGYYVLIYDSWYADGKYQIAADDLDNVIENTIDFLNREVE